MGLHATNSVSFTVIQRCQAVSCRPMHDSNTAETWKRALAILHESKLVFVQSILSDIEWSPSICVRKSPSLPGSYDEIRSGKSDLADRRDFPG
jgi:hypothetical protein